MSSRAISNTPACRFPRTPTSGLTSSLIAVANPGFQAELTAEAKRSYGSNFSPYEGGTSNEITFTANPQVLCRKDFAENRMR